MPANEENRPYLTVSQLTSQIKTLLESKMGEVWIRGEISNLRIPGSGHLYFTLKDEKAQISAVLFRGRMQGIRFDPKDGLEVYALGKISVYEPRGSYQIVVEFMEPAGLGALQAAFEKLKEKLAKEGLFEARYKKSLPFLPRRIGIVTSPTGAAIRDILKVLHRRNPLVHVLLAPAKVQGEGAAQEIAQAIFDLNERSKMAPEEDKIDLLIVGRGGGSLEDLWAFNEEVVARAIFAAEIPVISAVGHEIDFTIADFVADVRAPTPSAAAEMAVPVLDQLIKEVRELADSLTAQMRSILSADRESLAQWRARLVRPDRRLADLRLRLSDWLERLHQSLSVYLRHETLDLRGLCRLLFRTAPDKKIPNFRLHLTKQVEHQDRAVEKILLVIRSRLESQVQSLQTLSPLEILGRGYAVARDVKTKKIFKHIAEFHKDRNFRLVVRDGEVIAKACDIIQHNPLNLQAKVKPPAHSSQGELWQDNPGKSTP